MSVFMHLVGYGLKGGQIYLLLWVMNSNSKVSASTASTVKRSLTQIPTWPWASSMCAAKGKSRVVKLENEEKAAVTLCSTKAISVLICLIAKYRLRFKP